MQLLGIISVAFLIISLSFVEIKWGPDYSKTFSRLVAKRKTSIVFYFFIFIIFLTLFSLYIFQIFALDLGLPSSFYVIYTVGAIAQLICVSVPETGGAKTKVHLTAAGLMSVSVLAQVAIIILNVPLSDSVLAISLVNLLFMLGTWVIVSFRLRLARYELALQSVYFIAYLSTILTVGYLV